MESVNLTETNERENVSKAKANGASVLGCPCCDKRAHVQAHCCRLLYPPLQRCRACLDSGQYFTFQQPCFFNPQLLQPVFHSTSVPQSYCCSHDCINTNPSSDPNSWDQVNHECGKIRRNETLHTFCQKMKKIPQWDKMSAKNDVSENESSPLPQCQCQKREPQWNYQPCDCGESLSWTANPLVIPVVSYCVLWNPRNSNENFSNYSSKQMENLNKQNEETEDIFLSTQSNEKYNKDLDTENECPQDCLEDEKSKKKTEREHNKSSSFLSLHSFNQDESKIYDTKKKTSSPSITARSDVTSEDEELDEEVKDSGSSSNSQNHSSIKSYENVLSNIVDYSDIYSAGNESQRSSTAESETDLKAEDSIAEADDQIKCFNVFPEENNTNISSNISLETLKEKESGECDGTEAGPCNAKSKISPKKLIKNFTVTTRTESAFHGKPRILAAGGDLGGNNCPGYRVNIESEETQFESTREGSENQNSELRQILLQALEEKKSSSLPDKILLDSKTLRTPRTGIARLIQDGKPRDAKTDCTRNIKRETKESDYNDTKRRFLHDSQITEETSKLQKDKSPRMARHHKTGPEKQNPTSSFVSRSSKKDENCPAPKVRPHNCDPNFKKENK